MRKLIDIPDGIIQDLKILAVRTETDLKNYIQNLVIREHEKIILSETNHSERKATKYLNPAIKEFKKLGHENSKLNFKCYTEGAFVYELEEKDGSTHEVYIISDNTDFMDKMTISEILYKTPFYFSHRLFYKDGEEKKCKDVFEFRIGDTKEYKEKFNK
jgi:hypothetical protein